MGQMCMYSLIFYPDPSLTLNPNLNPNLTLNPNPKLTPKPNAYNANPLP